jgi:hypothetical protein
VTPGEQHPGAADAAAQLAALQDDRETLADRVLQPWWHDVAGGLLLFGFLASYALDSTGVTLVATVLYIAGLAWLAWTYRRRTGVWVHPDLKVWLTWVPLALLVLVPALALQDRGHDWAMVVAGAVLGVALAGLSRRWSREWVAELRGER